MSNHYSPYHSYHPSYPQSYGQGSAGPQPGQAHGPMAGGAYPGYPQQAYHGGAPQGAYAARPAAPFFNFSNDRFVKGLLIGAAATYLVTNEGVQRAVIKGVVRTWSMLQGGIEEIKERFEDAEAELHHDAERHAAQKEG
ncbi:hypothetical protein [Thiococcus pfennigii]|uniref:hypothetical protein n=1 Tax=Thiococcus pfennigii TaxID=1057 RepID=UPI001F5B27CF|nr:hypothetical protein [Thiococcus pfennigii]